MKKAMKMLALGMACVGGTSWIAGCASEVPKSSTGEPEVAARTLLADVTLSDSHSVQFWEYEPGEILAYEDRNIDEDQAAEIDILKRSLQDNYQRLIAISQNDRADAGELKALEAANLRVQAMWKKTGFDPLAASPRILDDSKVIPGDDFGGPAMSLAPGALPAVSQEPDTLASHAVCPEPAGWNWTGDNSWFADNFCFSCSTSGVVGCRYPVNQLCSTSVTWSYRAPRESSWYRAFGFAQAFCNTARMRVWSICEAGGISNGIVKKSILDQTLQPRHVGQGSWTSNGCEFESRTDGNAGQMPTRIGHGIQWVWY